MNNFFGMTSYRGNAGALSEAKAHQAARRLLAGDDLCTPYGIRTVATTVELLALWR